MLISKIIGKRNNNSTLMSKSIRNYLIIIIMMFLLIAYAIFSFKSFYSTIYYMLEDLVEIYSLHTELDKLQQQIVSYTNSNSKDSLTEYEKILSNLNNRIDVLKNSKNFDDDAYHRIKDIKTMLSSYDSESKGIIKDYDSGKGMIYVNHSVSKLSNLEGYIQGEITALLYQNLLTFETYYTEFRDKFNAKENVIYILVIFITISCVLFAINFSRHISIPIHKLVLMARKVAQGDLDIDRLEIKTNYELNSLIDSFNNMVVRLKKLIRDIEEKAFVENKLKEQEIKNLEISNLLNESELKFLQSQINPHFMFNTMNTIMSLAKIEGARQTVDMLKSMSEILRYNLKKIDVTVTLFDEIEMIKNYIYIQKMRFGGKIEYVLSIDESALDVKVPSMILQPFVENSIIHGLEPKVGKGVLEVCVIDGEELVTIKIKDNGVGMSDERLGSIMENKSKSIPDGDSRASIGVANVLRRLELKYGRNVAEMSSTEGVGTEVTLRIQKLSVKK